MSPEDDAMTLEGYDALAKSQHTLQQNCKGDDGIETTTTRQRRFTDLPKGFEVQTRAT